MKTQLGLCAVSAAALLLGSAHAQMVPGTITGDIGYSFIGLGIDGNLDDDDFDFDDFDELDEIEDEIFGDIGIGAITARGAYALTPYIAVEAELGFGVNDEESGGAGAESSFGIGYLAGLTGKFSYPVSPLFNVYARAGLTAVQVETETRFRGSFGGVDYSFEEETDETETAFVFGAGGTYQFTPVYYGRLDYTRYEFDDESESFDLDVNAYTIAVGRAF